MIFRLGSVKGQTGTSFALARSANGLRDFFLYDKEIFGSGDVELYDFSSHQEKLFGYQLIPNLTETSLVNLAFSSGLIGHALNIDTRKLSTLPATGQTTATFEFGPHPELNSVWRHSRGQVEIDALFVEDDAQKRVFVLESKVGNPTGDLAKHKLAYPVLAIMDSVPDSYEIVPIYMKIEKNSGDLIFHIAVCEFVDPHLDNQYVSNVKPKWSKSLMMANFSPV